MSEHTDATQDRDDEPEEPVARDEPDADEPDADEPQPWAKALPGDGEQND